MISFVIIFPIKKLGDSNPGSKQQHRPTGSATCRLQRYPVATHLCTEGRRNEGCRCWLAAAGSTWPRSRKRRWSRENQSCSLRARVFLDCSLQVYHCKFSMRDTRESYSGLVSHGQGKWNWKAGGNFALSEVCSLSLAQQQYRQPCKFMLIPENHWM